jgi:3-methyladenine DNA glycosylase AlkC
MKYYFNNYLYSFASELSDNIDFIINKYPTLETQIKSLPIKYKKWLVDRFIEPPITTEIHSIKDCLPTLKIFSEKENGISAKYNSNQQFKNDIDNEFPPSDRGWLNPGDATSLSKDNMERILSLSEKKKAKVKLDTTTSYESDRIGKVGSWNIWLPSTQQNSINIAGYNQETNTPYTDWCTARISGSNLFYNYINPNFMLFYVIKDNPNSANDWLSIGVENGEIIYSGDGNETVNRDNKELTEESLKGILGESTFEQISSIMLDKYESLSGQPPGSVKIKEAAESLDKLKEMVRTNSESEKDYFYKNLLRNYEVSEEILEYISNSKNTYLRQLVANKTDNEKILEQLARDEDEYVRIAVAEKTNNEKLLEKLALDEKPYVRKEVAKNNNTNENLLEILARDEYPYVRLAVAEKTNNEKILEQLARDEDHHVRMTVARKTDNEKILEQLARDEDHYVRRELVYKTNNEKILEQLARDEDHYVRRQVAKKTNNEKILEQLAGDKDPGVRIAVARKTDNEKILEQLARDEDPYPRQIAKSKLQDLKIKDLKIKASSNKINQILKKATLYYKLTTY